MDPAVGDLLRQAQPITIRAPPRLRSGEFPAHVADSLYFRRRCLRRVGYLLPYPLLDRFGADRPDLDPRDHLRRLRRRQREQGTVVPLPGEYPSVEIVRLNRLGAPHRPQKAVQVITELYHVLYTPEC